ncbi:hypothetical protein [Phocaeicola sartorii]|uniref:hypothetical protein n=1 Tax=Phocaeicola sartorii TaxID=671267 RepID=UPI0025A9AAFA|nr:hypothetical protein [Phocaeicola sartorii]
MKKYVIDTNVLYGLVFKDGRCNLDNTLNVLTGNKGIVTYGTLFEAFNRYKDKKEDLITIIKFLDDYKFEVAGNSKKDDELFWKLIYSEKELSDLGLMALKGLLISQTSDYVCRVLGEIFKAFAVLYMNMKLNKAEDAYSMYVRYSAIVTDNFSHFPLLVRKRFEGQFLVSYTQDNSKKFSAIVQREFWGIIRSIETHYKTLSEKAPEYIEENDFSEELKRVTEEFDKKYCERDYLAFLQEAHAQMKNSEKMFSDDNDIFSVIDYQALSPLEKDFLNYCIQRRLINQGKFKYNDIIDFMNLSTAFRYADGLMTLDKPFLTKTVSNFSCMANSAFLQTSLGLMGTIS